jgi:hypothetical protein
VPFFKIERIIGLEKPWGLCTDNEGLSISSHPEKCGVFPAGRGA